MCSTPVASGVRPQANERASPTLETACRAFQQGRFVMIYDGDEREGEVDLFVPAQAAEPSQIGRLRNDAGGLVFVAIGPDLHRSLDLPFLHELFEESEDRWPVLNGLRADELPYDARSSFSITLNHRDTFTGITDEDRATTVQALGRLASLEPCIPPEDLRERFTESFRTPGHVHLCSAARGLLDTREGHTELAVALARAAGVPEAVVGAEILDGEDAMTQARARQRAEAQGIPFLHADDIREAWGTIQETPDHIAAHT